jgi:hypothetical protein
LRNTSEEDLREPPAPIKLVVTGVMKTRVIAMTEGMAVDKRMILKPNLTGASGISTTVTKGPPTTLLRLLRRPGRDWLLPLHLAMVG